MSEFHDMKCVLQKGEATQETSWAAEVSMENRSMEKIGAPQRRLPNGDAMRIADLRAQHRALMQRGMRRCHFARPSTTRHHGGARGKSDRF